MPCCTAWRLPRYRRGPAETLRSAAHSGGSAPEPPAAASESRGRAPSWSLLAASPEGARPPGPRQGRLTASLRDGLRPPLPQTGRPGWLTPTPRGETSPTRSGAGSPASAGRRLAWRARVHRGVSAATCAPCCADGPRHQPGAVLVFGVVSGGGHGGPGGGGAGRRAAAGARGSGARRVGPGTGRGGGASRSPAPTAGVPTGRAGWPRSVAAATRRGATREPARTPPQRSPSRHRQQPSSTTQSASQRATQSHETTQDRPHLTRVVSESKDMDLGILIFLVFAT